MLLTTVVKQNVCVCVADLEAKYCVLGQLGGGGCGSVFAGFRKADMFPVSNIHTHTDTHTKTRTHTKKAITKLVLLSCRWRSSTYRRNIFTADKWLVTNTEYSTVTITSLTF